MEAAMETAEAAMEAAMEAKCTVKGGFEMAAAAEGIAEAVWAVQRQEVAAAAGSVEAVCKMAVA